MIAQVGGEAVGGRLFLIRRPLVAWGFCCMAAEKQRGWAVATALVLASFAAHLLLSHCVCPLIMTPALFRSHTCVCAGMRARTKCMCCVHLCAMCLSMQKDTHVCVMCDNYYIHPSPPPVQVGMLRVYKRWHHIGIIGVSAGMAHAHMSCAQQ